MPKTFPWRRAACIAAVALASSVLLGACGDSTESPAALSSSTLELAGTEGRVVITVEVADSVSERRRGLSGRDELAADTGMLFVNEGNVTTGFQMEDTTIPLSLAFVDETGSIIAIVDMEPCATATCETYKPPAPYRLALEVNQGAFEGWMIMPGDSVVVQSDE